MPTTMQNNIHLRITSLVENDDTKISNNKPDDDNELRKEGCEILDKINRLIFHRDKYSSKET
jgi:hypothetical protein